MITGRWGRHGRTLRLAHQFGDMRGAIDVVRVEEYAPRPVTFLTYASSSMRRSSVHFFPLTASDERWLRERWP